MIELNLRVKEARKVLQTLGGICTDMDLAEVYRRLHEAIESHDAAKAQLPPWRKVVGKDRSAVYLYERLECGHTYQLRQGKRYVEDWAEKRRCRACAGLPSRFA
jgi:hypothetical protein